MIENGYLRVEVEAAGMEVLQQAGQHQLRDIEQEIEVLG